MRRERALFARALPVLVLAFAVSTSLAAERVLDKTFNATPGGVINVNADGASITVVGNSSGQVVLHMVAKGSQGELDDMKFVASQDGDSINIEMRRKDSRSWFNWGSWGEESRIEVTAPSSYKVQAKTSGGSMRLEDVSGPSRLRTSGGSIAAKNIKGDLEGHTSGGSIRLEAIDGTVFAHTSGGGVTASTIHGSIDASTSGGSVNLAGNDGRIRASTSGGSVHCEIVGANRGISATTSGGGIRVTMPKGTAGMLDAASSGGSINTDFPVTATRFAENRLSGSINGGGEPIYVRTSGGGITIDEK
jgi:hypothetical protein